MEISQIKMRGGINIKNKGNIFLLLFGLIWIVVGVFLLYEGASAWISGNLISAELAKTEFGGFQKTLMVATMSTGEEIWLTGFQYCLFALGWIVGGLLVIANYLGTRKLGALAGGFFTIFLGWFWLSVSDKTNDNIINFVTGLFVFVGLAIIMRVVLNKKRVEGKKFN